MSRRKLELYENIFNRVGPGKSNVTIVEVAAFLHCSERHARTLLNQMTTLGWLTWSPTVGRGNKGILNCLLEPIQACHKEIDKANDNSNLDLVYKLVGFNGRDTAAGLWQYLSQAVTEKHNTILAPFHRCMKTLHPHFVTERTERHFISEIYQTLVEEKANKVAGNLAHFWESNHNHTVWTFYLRPETQFHDLSLLTADDVVASFKGLIHSAQWQRLYDHIEKVIAVSFDVVEIHLSTPDPFFTQLLCRAETAIMPKQFVFANESHFKAIGSGPFSLAVNSNKLVRLQRFSQYNRTSALIEKIEFWIHENWAERKKCYQNFFFLNDSLKVYETACDYVGSFYCLIANKQLQTQEVKQNLAAAFLGNQAQADTEYSVYTVSHENNRECREYAKQLLSYFDNLHAPQTLKMKEVKFGQFLDGLDVSILGVRKEDNKYTSLFAFLKLYPHWASALSFTQHDYLQQKIAAIRIEADVVRQQALISHVMTWLEQQHILFEIKREGLTLTVPEQIQGVEINANGWCNFSKLWIKPSKEKSGVTSSMESLIAKY
ncbi:SgrR family transcriptional regulator [Photobacterium leiognathi]|uniref:SgrR family transcriptional regulator n=1 Tax=Photobacterium leiognathi TaxID=553611 RepID=UPI002981B72B|nr:SgrR family transcriptional regulator [Photobacterium leiognathi]